MKTVLTGFPSQNFGAFFLLPILHTQTICGSSELSLNCSESQWIFNNFFNYQLNSNFFPKRDKHFSNSLYIFFLLLLLVLQDFDSQTSQIMMPTSSTSFWLQIALKIMPVFRMTSKSLCSCFWPFLSSLTDIFVVLVHIEHPSSSWDHCIYHSLFLECV